jgi:hypothetical protein
MGRFLFPQDIRALSASHFLDRITGEISNEFPGIREILL